MKHVSILKKAILFIAAGIVFSSCKKDKENNTENTITDVVVNNAAYSLLEQAVVRASLATTLSGEGPYTVFAPTDAAFASAGIDAAVINSLSADELKAILLYHTLGAQVMAADVPAGPNARVTTASGDSVFVTKNANGVFINGVAVTQADVLADNGVIHAVGKVLLPPSGTIVETAQAAGLDSLVKAVVRATNGPGGDPALVTTLSTATLTVFAPTNAAFTQLLSALSLSDINDIPMSTLLAVLRYHVVAGRAFSSDLSNGSLAMLAGGNTTVSLTGGVGITGTGNSGNTSSVLATNIMCRNGVVHLIDRVLLP